MESEQALLGCIFLNAATVMPLCIERFGGQTDRFYDLRHQTIFQCMLELWEDQAPIEVVSVYERLQAWGHAEQVGGVAYIAPLPDAAPSAASAEYYLSTIVDKYHERQMICVCTEAVGRIYDHEGDTSTLMDTVERDVLRVAESRTTRETPSALELVRNTIHNFETYHERRGQLIGLDTGFVDFNRLTTGLRAGDMVVIAARPSMGKTSLAMNIAEHVAVTNNIPTGIWSLEMTADQLMERMLSSRARVNLQAIRAGHLTGELMDRIVTASGPISHAPLYIDDKAGQSILEVRAKARRWKQQHDIRLGVIDYLQLMNALGGKRKFESRQQEVSDISTGVKNLAKELGIPIIVLSQLNRDVERDKTRKPRLSDLRESGSIEQDADVVGFLHRDQNTEDADGADNSVIRINLHIAKQRNGPTGDVPLIFQKSFTRFQSATVDEEESAPEPEHQAALPYNES